VCHQPCASPEHSARASEQCFPARRSVLGRP
jgi:hypothetical protein